MTDDHAPRPSGIATYPSLKGRVALITGGGSGIGATIVRRFAEQGCRVAFFDIAEETSRALVAALAKDGLTAHFEKVDITRVDDIQAAISRVRAELGPITILVNNAANDDRHKLDDVTSEYWDWAVSVNLKHQFFCAQAVHKGMAAAGGGAIINMSSISYLMGAADNDAYLSAKSAVIGLTRGLARELGPDNIRVNSVLPGWIITERQRRLWLNADGEKRILERQCLKRQLDADDIARPVLFLASDEAGACTNQSFIVDGGWV
ncbi:MAG TPA: SDR family oxidoreductase [Kaistia sp.]|jgi:NAD(P)-dependent dehydrogenase (short-subunit alcohol dehydrogenase family)|nr:SDR family oxidoreductase [Kaistia sp.]